jgi:hypothetical protein
MERLRKTDFQEVSRDGFRREELVPVNPDGPEAADTIEELVETLKEARNYVEACSVYVKEKRGGRGWWTCDQLLANCDALLATLEAGDTK